jgi:hypothetical protein
MSRLLDPTICPDCRAPLDREATCTGCGLEVTGDLAAELWQRMVAADRVVEQLRALSRHTRPTQLPLAPVAASARAAHLPAFPRQDGPDRPRRLPAASVPVVLLSLGALCLLVAAVVFVAVAWSVLGLTGRTLVLLGVTTLLAVVAVVLTRKNLRGAAETFWLVVAGMLTVDLLGARSAGLAGFDTLDWRATGALVGMALVVLGLGVGVWAHHHPVRRLYGMESIAVVGALVVSATNAWGAANPALACSIAVPLLAALFVGLRGLLPLTAYGVAGLGATSWLVLLLTGWDRALEPVSLGAWWSDFHGWPLLVAALLAAAVVHAPSVPEHLRPVAAGLALLPLALLADAPQTPGAQTRALAVAALVVLVLGLVAFGAPRPWARGAAALASVGVLGLGAVLVVAPWDALAPLSSDGTDPVDLRMVGWDAGIAAWTLGWVAVAVAVTLVLLQRQVPVRYRTIAAPSVGAVAPAVIGLGALDLAWALEPPLWAGVLAAALAAAVGGGAAWWARDRRVAAWVGVASTAYLTAVALRAAAADDLLLAVTLSALALALLAVHVLREADDGELSAAAAGTLAALTGGWALIAWGSHLRADHDEVAIALALYAALVGVLAAPATRRPASRIAFEVSALLVGAVAVTYPSDGQTSAMALTVVGSAICLVSVMRRDRELFSWLGAVVLGLATALRVALEVQAPELYTLPAALALVAVGGWRLHRDDSTSSFATLGSGLTLGLLPSLLLALEQPLSLRGALAGAAGVLALAVGVRLRLAAPFVLGAVTVGLLAVRHLQPYADAVPRWISLGAVGLALLVVGVTWEARRHNLETAGRYLAELR